MAFSRQNDLSEEDKAKSKILVLTSTIIVISILVLGFVGIAINDIPAGIFLACYVVGVIILVINFRNPGGIALLLGAKNIKRPGLILHLLALFTIVMTAAISKYIFNVMSLMNQVIAVCTVLCSILFIICVLYKNQNFAPSEASGGDYLILIVALALFVGYGFSLCLNCFEFTNSSKTYTLVIKAKYTETRHGKGGIYHRLHFVVENWPQTDIFGNDIIIISDARSEYANSQNVNTGDSVIFSVHPGTLNLGWIELVKFKSLQ